MSKNGENDNINNNHKFNQNTQIMIIDDDYDIATLVKEAFQRSGFRKVFAFTDPDTAMEQFKMNYKDYSLVISDIRMPQMNGFEFAKRVSKIKPEIKVLLMTAFDINDDALLDMNVKYNKSVIGVIEKPISPMKIAKIVAGR